MQKELLHLRPKSYLCPICGEWHEWKHGYCLNKYSSEIPAKFSHSILCPHECAVEEYTIYVDNEFLYYTTGRMCGRARLNLNGKIPIESIIEHVDKPIVTFEVDFTAAQKINRNICAECPFLSKCNLIKLSEKANSIQFKIPLGFEFEMDDYKKYSKAWSHLNNEQNALKSKKRKRANPTNNLQKNVSKEIKEDTTMSSNNNFNINMEFGPNTDINIRSTLMGIAVKNNNGTWRIYDKKKKEIIDIGDMQLGNLPIFIMPTTKLNEGDLVKSDGEYYFVIKTGKGNTQTMSAKTGEMKTIIPVKNILGFSCYSKVIAFCDSMNTGDDFDIEKLAIMSAMCGQSANCGEQGESMNQLLPLMFMKDGKFGSDDEMIKMLYLANMMSNQGECREQNTAMNQLLPFMLMKDEKVGCDDEMIKMLCLANMMNNQEEYDEQNAAMNQLLPFMLMKDEKVGGDESIKKLLIMSSMMGNTVSNGNPFMTYLMCDMILDEKKDNSTN